MKKLIYCIIILFLVGCASLFERASRREQMQQCILKMSEKDIPPLKALKICKEIFTEKDLQLEEELIKEGI